MVFVEGLLKRRGVRTTQGAPVFVCRRVVGGGGVRTTDGAPVFVCTIKKKQREGIADWLLPGRGGAEQHKGPQSLFVE